MMENNENQELIDKMINNTINPGAPEPKLTEEEMKRMRASDWAEIYGKELEIVNNRIEDLTTVKNSLEKAYQLAMMMTISEDAMDDFLKSWKEMKEKFEENE